MTDLSRWTKTILVKNISRNTSVNKLLEIFENFGKIRKLRKFAKKAYI